MVFKTKHIRGHGRGHSLGFPTINCTIPDDFILEDGVYAVWVEIGGVTYKGALHFGPVPTFDQKEKTLEVYLLDVTDDTAPLTGEMPIEVDIVNRVRDIRRFTDSSSLSAQIALDVAMIRKILS